MTRRQATFTCGTALAGLAIGGNAHARPPIRTVRAPKGGLQSQVVMDDRGILHVVYYTGDARNGDLF